MTQNRLHVRSGLTAIAAVLALSSTPLAAQEVTTPPEPVTESPTPAPAADPLAPEPTASAPAASEAKPAATTKRATTTRRASTSTSTVARPARQPVRAAAPAIAPGASAPAVEPAAAPPPVPVAEAPVPEPVPPVAEPAPATTNLMADETLPIAGAAGLGLLALGGIGLALSRRRRRRDELEHHRAAEAFLDQHPEAAAVARPSDEPAFFRPSQPAAAPATAPEAAVIEDAPRTELPRGFDLSRFGPHVRAAYLGPTPDNPSLSLKYRLRRAGAMDQRERLEAEKRPTAPTPAAREPARQPAWASSNGDGFMLRRAGSDKAESPVTRH
jgi:hypothetical protein